MRCAQCGFDNPGDGKFCGQCGASLKPHCAQCGAENPPGFRFCGQCGAPLQATPAAEAPTPTDGSLPDAERRQVTVMFCDLVGSTPLAEQLDPEDLRSLLHAYQDACLHVIRRYDGRLAKYLGDGILVYFGFPRAHEDDAIRAAHTALALLEAVDNLNERFQRERGVRLQIRIGIHTGLVVAGAMGWTEEFEADAVVGQTPNIAARLQGFAQPGTAVLSEATHQLIRGYFHCEYLDRQPLKGVSEPVPIYRVLRASAARSRLEAQTPGSLTPLVAREVEVADLVSRWERARRGTGQAVLLTAEAGTGKSRLVQALKEHVASDPDAWLTESRCSPYYQHTPFYPVVDLFERVVLQFERDESAESRRGKIEGFLAQYGLALDVNVPLFAALLSVPLDGAYPPLDVNPARQKQKTLEALVTVLLRRAARQTVLFVVEDLHWADPSTLELIDLILERAPESRLMVALTTRPSPPFRTSWEAHLHRMTIGRLSRSDTKQMIQRIAGERALPAEVTAQLIVKTDGVPLFVEETTKMVLQSGQLIAEGDRYVLSGPLVDLAIPATLQDSLVARLDHLDNVKTVAQIGAILGREFGYDLLRAVAPLDARTLNESLAKLVNAEILYQRGVPPDSTYLFKHALLQDAAYQSTLKSVRQQYHRQTAKALLERFPDAAEASPELVARHYTEAGLIEQAVPLWLKASRRSIQSSAMPEAIAHLNTGFAQLGLLPATPERDRMELDLRVTLGTALIATRGYSTDDVAAAFARARELCVRLGDSAQTSAALWGLWAFHVVRGEFATATELGEELLAIATAAEDEDLLLEVQPVLVHNHFWTGDLAGARRHAELGVRMYDPQRHSAHAAAYGQDPCVVCLAYLAWILWLQGLPDQGAAQCEAAIARARSVGHAHSIGYALAFAAFFHQLRGETDAAESTADATIALAAEHGFPVWLADGDMIRGWARTCGTGDTGAIAQFQRGFDAWDAFGARLCRSQHFSMLAEIQMRQGDVEGAGVTLQRAFEYVRSSGEAHYHAELLRLRGELLHMQCAGCSAAEAAVREALGLARAQGARGWELRAAMSLARVTGYAEEAMNEVTEVVGQYTEGFATPDLVAAEALLTHAGRGAANA